MFVTIMYTNNVIHITNYIKLTILLVVLSILHVAASQRAQNVHSTINRTLLSIPSKLPFMNLIISSSKPLILRENGIQY